MDGTHGFGYGITGAQLRARVAGGGRCSGCVGTGRQWCLATRTSVPCRACGVGDAGGGTVAVSEGYRVIRAGVGPVRKAA